MIYLLDVTQHVDARVGINVLVRELFPLLIVTCAIWSIEQLIWNPSADR